MENCLVTKLKGVVNNDNLEKLGVIKLQMTPYTSNSKYYLAFYLGANQHEITVKDSTIVSAISSGLTEKIDDHHARYLGTATKRNGIIEVSSNSDTFVEIDNKYNLEYFSFGNSRVTHIVGGLDKVSAGVKSIMISNYQDEINTNELLRFTSIEEFSIGSIFYSIVGDLSSIASLTALTTFIANNAKNKISGDISTLGSLVNLQDFFVSGNKSITGSLEGFVAAQRAAGRETESTGIRFSVGIHNVTFNGESSLRAAGSSCILTWTADTITYDGVTINA